LAAKVETALAADPFNGHVFVFRGRRGDTIKVLWATEDGKRLTSLSITHIFLRQD
jgi:transposase